MLVIFAGAGASMAVSKSYPTTLKFFELLPDHIKQDKLFQQTVEWVRRLKAKATETPVDIEEVLWVLGELKGFFSKSVGDDSLVRWFLDGNRLTNVLGVSENSSQFPALADHSLTRIASVMSDINRRVYDLYDETPEGSALSTNWISLLRTCPPNFQLFTTNYDRVIETALLIADVRCQTGRIGGATNPRLDLETWKKGIPGVQPSLLTKLHGSVDWVRKSGDTIYVGTPIYSGSHERHVILYPGFKGEPAVEPFGMFHRYFATSLADATTALFIGFAFRDEYINQLIRENLPRESQVVILDPQASLIHPFANKAKVTHVQALFDADGVAAIARALGWQTTSRLEAAP